MLPPHHRLQEITRTVRIAFMFLTPGPLPSKDAWTKFFQGHEDQYSVYVHASAPNSSDIYWTCKAFLGRLIRSQRILWGQISMVDAKRRLLAAALADMDNEITSSLLYYLTRIPSSFLCSSRQA